MKGVVFNVVEEAISREWGEQMWDDLLAAADLDGAYTAVGSYPDAHLFAVVKAASDRLNAPTEDVLRTIGRMVFEPLLSRFKGFHEEPPSMREFLPTINDWIHPQVLKLYPGASVPRFVLRENGDDLELDYLSVRNLCTLAEGLVLGVADHYGETVTVDQLSCKERGDSRCTIRIATPA
jgi:hypothetical protein